MINTDPEFDFAAWTTLPYINVTRVSFLGVLEPFEKRMYKASLIANDSFPSV